MIRMHRYLYGERNRGQSPSASMDTVCFGDFWIVRVVAKCRKVLGVSYRKGFFMG